MKKAILLFLFVLGCDISIKPNGSDSTLLKKDSLIVRIDTLYRVDTVIKEIERLRVDTVVTARLDTIIVKDTIVNYKIDTVEKQIYKVDTLFKYDTIRKRDTTFIWWKVVDTVYKRDTLVLKDTVINYIRDTISAKVILLKDTLTLRVGDTTRLQYGDSLIIPIKVLKACTVP